MRRRNPTRARSTSSSSNAATKQPIELARVLLDGPVITSELTGKNGKVVFTDVPDGIYRARIVHRGYTSLTSASFEVLDGRVVTVSFALAHGYRRLESDRTGDRQGLGDDFEQQHRSKLAAAPALDRSGRRAEQALRRHGLDLERRQRRDADDLARRSRRLPDAADARRHSAQRARARRAIWAASRPISSKARRAHGPARWAASAARVNFSTLQPTLSWITQMQLSAGSNGRYNYSLAETGSVGKLGLAVQTVNRLYPSLVDGDLYVDASGLDYVHDGDSTISGQRDHRSLRVRRLQLAERPVHELDPQHRTSSACATTATRDHAALRLRPQQHAMRATCSSTRSRTTHCVGATQLQAFDLLDGCEQPARRAGSLRQRPALAERILDGYALCRLLVERHASGATAPHDFDSSVRNVVAVYDHAVGPGSRAVLQRLGDDAVQRVAGDRCDPLER